MSTSYLTFVTYKKRDEAELIELSDGLGNAIAMPKFGYLTWKEKKALSEHTAKAAKIPDMLIETFEFEIASLLTKIRLNIDPEVSNEEIMVNEEGEPVSEVLIKQIYEFFIKEQLKWEESAIAQWQQQSALLTQLALNQQQASLATDKAEIDSPIEPIAETVKLSTKKGFKK